MAFKRPLKRHFKGLLDAFSRPLKGILRVFNRPLKKPKGLEKALLRPLTGL
jgi:hypothetical protein